MATVSLAADLRHDRKVAINVLKPELAAVLGAERFVQEIKTTAALSGCFLRIGARDSGGEPIPPAHAPRFVAAEASIFVGAAVLAECARGSERAAGAIRV